MKKDYYEVLGVDKGADEATIKAAYRKLAKKNHPDVNPGDKDAEERFKEINEAYQVLSNPQKRAEYDQYGFDGRRRPVSAAAATADSAAETLAADSADSRICSHRFSPAARVRAATAPRPATTFDMI